jgi:ribosomal protein L11 methyltransferase
VRRLAFTIPGDAFEEVLDRLLPLLPQGVHPAELDDRTMELAVYGNGEEMPPREALEAAVGDALIGSAVEDDVPEDPGERRVRYMRPVVVGGRIVVRPSNASPGPPDLLDLVIDSPAGAFGTGAHPTTTMCLELMLELEPRGGFADLGTGAGVLAIAASLLGWAPVFAVDHEPAGVEATLRNAARNGAQVEALEADLFEIPPPPAPTIAANVPPAVHQAIAQGLTEEVRHVIVSGVIAPHLPGVLAAYGEAGLFPSAQRGSERGWAAVLLERRD